MAEPIRRLHGRMIRPHYRTMAGCACTAWCAGYNEAVHDERRRTADKPIRTSEPPKAPGEQHPYLTQLVATWADE